MLTRSTRLKPKFNRGFSIIAVALLAGMTVLSAQPAGGRGGGGRGSRFKIYPAEAVNRGLPAYNSTCGYCHGARGKGGQAGPDLIFSSVTLHDEDGVQLAQHVRGPEHSKVAKVEVADSQMADIAAYLHSRVIYASGRGDVRLAEVLVGDTKSGEQYFNGGGGCNKCHSPTGNLKGVGGKYDVATLQDRLVMPRAGRGGFGRPELAPFATVTLPSGESIKGAPVRVTDFDVVIRLSDGSTKTWARNRGVPRVEITDPLQAHIDIMKRLSDTDMHNLTAYLATLK
jgi:mono/diheme cytochrome c family protein